MEVNKKINLDILPNKIGCYIFYNINNEIIYVGKAINLANRVKSYFSKKINNFKTIQLVSEINSLKYLLTNNEKEALLLESNLIKKYKPRYNILLNDDKRYPYIIITKEKDPQIKLVRNKAKNAKYQFGPFPDGTKAYEILKIIKRLYPLRACKGNLKKPCLNYQIDQCLGSCYKKVDQNLYNENIKKIKTFFKGKINNLENELTIKMMNYANNLQFEQANKIKEIIKKINFSISKQFTNITRLKDTDFINYIIQDGYLIICIYFYRRGELLSKDYKIFENFSLDITNTIISYLIQLYNKIPTPDTIISDFELDSLKNLYKSNIIMIKNNEDKNILKQMKEDARIFLNLAIKNENSILGKELLLLNELKEVCNLNSIPFTFEVYDISNIKNNAQTAGVIVYRNGLPSYKDFRHYNLNENLNSDYSRIQELIKLRFIKNSTNTPPNLVIVDGGLIQINAIRKTLNGMFPNLNIIGLVKDDKHRTSHIILENQSNIHIKNKTLFNYLTNIQDKVHNFAISQHKKLRKKEMFK